MGCRDRLAQPSEGILPRSPYRVSSIVGRYAGDPESLAAIERVLTRAGVEFTNGNQPGVRLRKSRFKS
jgi:hypothetical protein